MLVGLSLLVGSIVMLAWDDPVPFTEEEGISGNARLGGGDSVDMTYIMDQTSVVTIRFQLEAKRRCSSPRLWLRATRTPPPLT